MDTEASCIFDGLKPGRIRKMLRDEVEFEGTITAEDLDKAFACAYPEATEPDLENINHQKTLEAIEIRRKYLAEDAAEKVDDLRQKAIEWARGYLNEQGIDASVLPDDVLHAIAVQQAAQSTVLDDTVDGAEIIMRDDESGFIVAPDGTVLGIIGVEPGVGPKQVLEMVGERLAWSEARKAGLAAERQVWLDKISKIYDPQINAVDRRIAFAKHSYLPMARQYINDANAVLEPKKRVRHLKVGLLTIQLGKTSARVEVEDDSLAIASLRALYEDEEGKALVEKMIAKKETIAKSAIPAPMKEALDLEGIYWVPGGDDTCELK